MSNRDSDGGLIDYPAQPETDAVEPSEREIGEYILANYYGLLGEISLYDVAEFQRHTEQTNEDALAFIFDSLSCGSMSGWVAKLIESCNPALYERVKARLRAAAVAYKAERPDREED